MKKEEYEEYRTELRKINDRLRIIQKKVKINNLKLSNARINISSFISDIDTKLTKFQRNQTLN